MTKFEELMDIINRKRRPDNMELSDSNDSQELEVAGSESSKTPLISCGDDQTDPDLLDQLHRSIKTEPNDGSGSSSWDSNWD